MKKFFKIIAYPAVICAALCAKYRKWLEISKTEIDTDIPVDLRLCVISDLHDYQYGKNNSVLLNSIKNAAPDYVCICGDLTNSYGNKTERAVKLVKDIVSMGITVIYVQGNHELNMERAYPSVKEKYIQRIKEAGAVLLDDECFTAGNVNFIGYTNKLKQYKRIRGLYKLSYDELEEELDKKAGRMIKDGKYNIMLAHNPVYFKQYAAYGADLVLSGHLHGGIIRLPIIGGIMSPQTFFGTRYSAGLYTEGKAKMYVSRGLGLHTIHLRLFNRPELAMIHIKKK